jgi:hypothetical protein
MDFKRLFGILTGFIPRRLPIGAKELIDFSSNVFSLYGIPDLPSYRLCIATLIMHLGPQVAFKSPFWFYLSIRSAQSKEVAYQVIADDREQRNKEEREAKQKAYDLKKAELENKADELLKQAAVTASNGATDASTIQTA